MGRMALRRSWMLWPCFRSKDGSGFRGRLDIFHCPPVVVFLDVSGRHQIVGDLFEIQHGYEVDPSLRESCPAALLTLNQGNGIFHKQSGFTEGRRGLKNAPAARDQVIHDQAGLAKDKYALDSVRFIGRRRVDVDHRRAAVERESRCEVQSSEGDPGN